MHLGMAVGRHFLVCGASLFLVVAGYKLCSGANVSQPRNEATVFVEVDQLNPRAGDKMPARVAVTGEKLFGDAQALIDPSSVQIEAA